MAPNSTIDIARETRLLRLGFVLGLLAAIGGATLWIGLARPENLGYVFWSTVGFLTVPGKYVVFVGLTSASPLGPWGLAVIGLLADTLLALLLTAMLEPLGAMRGVGPWLRSMHERAAVVLREYPGLRRMAFWGVALFVFLPLPGTGAVGGTFAGQLMGLSRIQTVLAIAVGSAVTLVLFAGMAAILGARAEEMVKNPWVVAVSVAVLAVFGWIAYGRVKTALTRR
jgi:uncharacterized membrane protein